MGKIKNLLLVLAVIGLAYFTYSLLNKKKSSLSVNALSNFAIKDTASIDRLIISDNMQGNVEFVKKDGEWSFPDGNCVQIHMIESFLETIKYISIKSPLPKSSVKNVSKRILGHHKKLEIYQNGKLSKTWFIGSSTADHYGTYMILKNEGEGISPEPFITYVPSGYGNLTDQFSLRRKDYECSEIFAYDPLEIKSINVIVGADQTQNFKIISLEKNIFELYNNEEKVEVFDTSAVRNYLVSFKKIHYDVKEPIIPIGIRDSTMNSQFQYHIEVVDNKGETRSVKTYLKISESDNYNLEGNLVPNDLNSLYAVTGLETFVQIQYFVFDKLLKDLNDFKK